MRTSLGQGLDCEAGYVVATPQKGNFGRAAPILTKYSQGVWPIIHCGALSIQL
jgi:hypothetical protein